MNEQEKVSSELPIRAESETLVNPTCEEGGDAKLREGVGANAELTTACETGPAEFCITEKKEGTDEEELSALSVLAQVARVGRRPKLNAELKSRVCFLLGLGLSRRQAALAVDIDQATITHAAQNDADFSRALARAEEFSTMRPAIALATAGLSNWRAAAWELTHKPEVPRQLTAEEMEAEHQQYVLKRKYYHADAAVDEILSEQRDEARRLRESAREKARQQEHEAEEQAQFEAENPELFPRKRKKKGVTARAATD
ncbi:MAG: hypothetical protein K8R36_05905 [Planctomycetales bacterium]|nr:hypothetical protein [Planctomycetales bacterium]